MSIFLYEKSSNSIENWLRQIPTWILVEPYLKYI